MTSLSFGMSFIGLETSLAEIKEGLPTFFSFLYCIEFQETGQEFCVSGVDESYWKRTEGASERDRSNLSESTN